MNEIIKKLKSADVAKEIKWIYSLSAYVIQHQNDKEFHRKFQNRVNSTIRSHSGEYRKYISDRKWKEYRRKEKEVYKTDEKRRQYQLEQQRKRNYTYNLYVNKKLSDESMKIISKELENE